MNSVGLTAQAYFTLMAAAIRGDMSSKLRIANSHLIHRGHGRGTGINRTYQITYAKNGRQLAVPIDRSRYSPHQGKRECARRIRQREALA